jgi:hypothetical protein
MASMTPSATSRDPAYIRESALAGWSLCWGSAVLFSATTPPDWYSSFLRGASGSDISRAVVSALALFVVVQAPSLRSLGMLALAQVLQTVIDLPEVPNHRCILALVNLALLAAILLRRTPDGVLDALVPAARAITVTLYGFAAFAKLNHDFFDVSVSCAAQFYAHITSWWPPLPDGLEIRRLVMFGTIAVEGLLALGLCLRRLRPLAVFGGLLFHVGLALDATKAFLNFSSVMVALLLLFLPREFFASLGLMVGRRSAVRAELAILFVAVAATGVGAAIDWESFGGVFYWVRQLVWSTYAVAILAFTAWWCLTAYEPEPPLAWPPLGVLAVVLLALLNGLAPYLGLKTRTTFDMYSNLRLEARASNHLLIPRSLDLFGLLRDRVAILDSSDPLLQRYAAAGDEVPYWQLRASISSDPDLRVRYRRGEVVREYGPAHEQQSIETLSWWQRKLVIFRTLGPQSRGECLW